MAGVTTNYKVQTPDGSWHITDDLTGAELEGIQTALGLSWSALNPYRDINVYRAMVAAFAIRTGMDNSEIVDWFNSRTAKQLGAGLDIASDDDLDIPGAFQDGVPLAKDEPSTSSSASSPNPPSTGPQT